MANSPPWYSIALKELGIHEIPGPESAERILEYISSTTYPNPYEQDDSEVPWCSAFVNWVMTQAGIQGTGSAWARSWLNWGREPGDDEWGEGVIVILSRGENSGHVFFLSDWTDDTVTGIGGNQSDSVSIATFPQSRVLGYRVPV